MDYSRIAIAERVLEVACIPIPASEEAIRKQAYDYLVSKDFVAAHSIRLRKNYTEFTRDDWREVINISGKDAVRKNIGALANCMKYGLM